MDYPKQDQYHRPVFPDPDTGVEQAWTRVSTIAKELDNGGGLITWTGAMVAGGCYLRNDLVGQIGSRWPLTDANKAEIYALVDELKDAGGGSVGRNMGDALHEFLRRRNQGEKVRPMPPWDADVKAHDDLVDRLGLIIDPEYCEFTVCYPDLGIAGSPDLAPRVAGRGDERTIADYKTGSLRDYVWCAWVVQTCLYANAPLIYRWDTGQFEPMPPVSRKRAWIISIPAGSASAELWVLDISEAWKAVKAALWVREWRKTAKTRARPARVQS